MLLQNQQQNTNDQSVLQVCDEESPVPDLQQQQMQKENTVDEEKPK